jgi:Zeta toxin
MPYHLETRGSQTCVVKDADGETMGCHPSADEAKRQLAALYANEPKTAAARVDSSGWPLYPPSSWFDLPDEMPDDVYCNIVTEGPDAGRVYGYVHHAGTNLLGAPGGAWTPPPSPSALHDAQLGQTETAEGHVIRTANVGGGVNHARLASGFRDAVKHYENTASQLMRVRYHQKETPSGPVIAYAGAMWPDVSERDVLMARASGLSGDWRWRPEYNGYDFCGSQLVTNPGLPLRMVASVDDPEHPILVGPGDCEGDECDICYTAAPEPPPVEQRLDEIEDAVLEFADLLGYEIQPGPQTAAICAPYERIDEIECAIEELVKVAAAGKTWALDFRQRMKDEKAPQSEMAKELAAFDASRNPHVEKHPSEQSDEEWWIQDEHGRFQGSRPRTAGGEYIKGEGGLFAGSLPGAKGNRDVNKMIEATGLHQPEGTNVITKQAFKAYQDPSIAKREACEAVNQHMTVDRETLDQEAFEVFGQAYQTQAISDATLPITGPGLGFPIEVSGLGMTVEEYGQLTDLGHQLYNDDRGEQRDAFVEAMTAMHNENPDDPWNSPVQFTAREYLDLARANGFDPDAERGITSNYINRWAMTSGDSDPYAVAIQSVAGEKYDLDVSATRDYYATGGGADAQFRDERLREVDSIVERQGPLINAYLDASYKATQERLASVTNPDGTVLLYRGVHYDERWPVEPGVTKVSTNPLSSWSTSQDKAADFAHGDTYGYVLHTNIPVSSIISTPATGAGCLDEHEVVIIGGGEIEVQMRPATSSAQAEANEEMTSQLAPLELPPIGTAAGKAQFEGLQQEMHLPAKAAVDVGDGMVRNIDDAINADWPKRTDDTDAGVRARSAAAAQVATGPATAAAWNEDDHPRAPAGGSDGGQFTSGGDGGGGEDGHKDDQQTPTTPAQLDAGLRNLDANGYPPGYKLRVDPNDPRVAQALEHAEEVKGILEDAPKNEDLYATTLPDGSIVWDPDRVELQNEMVDKYWAEHNLDNVPSDGEALITGGLPGAGKSTALEAPELNVDTNDYVTLNPDEFKTFMLNNGMAPDVAGLKPLEKAGLIHEESSQMAKLLAERAYASNKNVIWDLTMNSTGSVAKRLDQLDENGYRTRMVYVDVPLAVSKDRAMGRYLDKADTEMGGRYIPDAWIDSQALDGPLGSKNREAFENLKDRAESWQRWTNYTGDTVLLEQG